MWSMTDEQRILTDTTARFVESEYSFEQRRSQIDGAHGYSTALWNKLAELGLLGLPFDDALGGFGGTPTDIALVMQQFGRGLVVTPYLPTVLLAGDIISRAGSDEERETLLPDLISGQQQLAFAFAEPQGRYDALDTLTRAVSQGGSYILNGRKSVVLNAPGADHIVVAARTAGEQRDAEGLSLFLVPRTAEGLSVRGYRLNDDHWAGDVRLDAVTVPDQALIGEPGKAWDVIEPALDRASVYACAEALGAMDRVMEMAKEYLNTREQFGRLIGKNQALQFRMVEMFYQVEEARSMVSWALRTLDGDAAARRTAVSGAKVKVGEAGRSIGEQGIQLHGAIGMTEEFPVGHYYKRLETLRVLFGDPDYHLGRFGRWNQAQNEP